jgi:hypothetical protein
MPDPDPGPGPLPAVDPSPPLLRPAAHRTVAILLLFLGVQLWLTFGSAYWRHLELRILAGVLIACFIPAVNRRLTPLLDRLRRRPTPRVAILIALAITAFAAFYIPYDAVRDLRPLAPRVQDEYSYLIQTQHVARGRLWMPAHPLPDFFESFQLLSTPVYASVYFPGLAMMLAPGVWLGLPTWVMPVVISAATVGATFLVVTYLLDTVAGLLAAALLLSLPLFRLMAIKSMSQIPVTLLSLLAIGAYLLWRRRRRSRHAALVGAMLGWAAIVRPMDAVCAGLPIAVAMLLDLRHSAARQALRPLLAATLAALPFLTLQLILNWGVTGNLLSTPYNLYVARDIPGAKYGFHPYDPAARPASHLVQKAEFLEHYRDWIAAHTPLRALHDLVQARLRSVLLSGVPHALLFVLVPVGLLGLAQRRWVLAAMAPAYLAVYYFHIFFLTQYDIVATPAIALIVVAAPAALAASFPRAGRPLSLFATAAIAILVLGQYREFNRLVVVDMMVTHQQNRIDQLLKDLPGRAIVLFRYNPGGLFDQEPASNVDVPWPDDARVIRAHDLGPARNPELFRYYANLHPDRTVYRYDRADDTLTPLGNVRDLADSPR